MTTIKYEGSSPVFNNEVGQETGSGNIEPGQKLELSAKLAKSILESNSNFNKVGKSTDG